MRRAATSSELEHCIPHASRQVSHASTCPSSRELPASVGRVLTTMSCVSSLCSRNVPTDLRTRTPARRTHALAGSRPGSSKLSVCAALTESDFRFSPGRAEACTSRSRPPRGRGASSAAHAEHVLTSKCCVGRSGAGGQRTATQHQTSTKRARACRRTSGRPIGLVRGPKTVAVAVVEHEQL